MIFSSSVFIFAFLPLVYLGFLLSHRVQGRVAVLCWLIASSLFFYGWWNPRYLLLIAVLIAANFLAARAIAAASSQRTRRRWLFAGLAMNIGTLLYYKYTGFLIQNLNALAGSHLFVEDIVLPLGISFFTFQKIAFLVDTYHGRVQRVAFGEYCLFVLFFPQLIAGPIVHHSEVVPQFRRLQQQRVNWDHLVLGLSIFFIGLFKKVVFADTLAAEVVNPAFGVTATGGSPLFLEAWGGVLGYTLEMYFDFSGYSDMAIGAALLFGIRLPQNFNSPFKASSIIDFWQRWHITLTRFLTAYIYNPLNLSLTRRRLARGLKGVGGRHTSFAALLSLLVLPTMVTMFISGFWHGAGYTFIIWGLLHGLYIAFNHAWRTLVRRQWRETPRYRQIMGPLGVALTFGGVVASMAFFRAHSAAEAVTMLRAMSGSGGIQLPASLQRLPGLSALGGRVFHFLTGSAAYGHIHGSRPLLAVAALLAWCWLLPNAQQIFAGHPTALGSEHVAPAPGWVRFEPGWKWATVLASVVLVGLLYVQSNIAQEFLYFDF
jgi:D-alanyl-lipoteichoic acid acyltransferase DltB (MBOAT superfamily)